jgi:hypothetical protein
MGSLLVLVTVLASILKHIRTMWAFMNCLIVSWAIIIRELVITMGAIMNLGSFSGLVLLHKFFQIIFCG